METSIFIARIIAIAYLASGIALINGNLSLKKTYQELKASNVATTTIGAFTLLLGMLIVNTHNTWELNWTTLITFIGWILLIEGIFYITSPKTLLNLFEKLPQSQTGWGIFTILMGLLFAYFGFLN